MKTEEFDDRIRQKVEAIDTPYTNAEVDAAFRYVKTKQAGFHFAKYTSHAAVAAAAACVAGLIVWNVMLHKQNNEQQNTIAALNQHFYKVEKLLQDKKTDTIYVVSTQNNAITRDNTNQEQDEVFSNENVVIDEPHNSSSLANQNKTALAFTNVEKETKDAQNKLFAQDGSANNEIKKTNQVNETAKNAIANSNTIYKEEQINNKTQNIKETAHETTNTIDNKEKSTNLSNEKLKTESQTNSTSVETSNFDVQDSISVDTYSGASVKTDSSAQENKELVEETKIADSVESIEPVIEEKIAEKKPTRKPIAWGELFSNFDFRYGTIVEGGRKQFGFGLVGELFVSNRLSLTTGAKFAFIHSQNFEDDNDYMRSHNNSFRNAFQQPSSTNATNINMITSLFQIPLYLTYYHPLRNNYSLLLSAGTDLDLRAWQNVGFEQQQNANREFHTFKTPVPTKIFNSVSIMAGLQKQWSICALQMNPYIVVPTLNTDYRENKIMGGLQLRVLFGGKNR